MIPSPLKSIRTECLSCCRGSASEVSLCPATGCPLHHVRFGRGVAGVSPLAAIRAKCIDCSGGSIAEVRRCVFDADHVRPCSLHLYRMGRNPNRSGIGGFRCSQKTTAQLAFESGDDTGRYLPSRDAALGSQGCSADGTVRPQGRTRGAAEQLVECA